ncbi:MAG: PIN domain-containing protein [Dehalococcoidia bacterium]
MTSGSIASLVDTNVLVYMVDSKVPSKQERAIVVMDELNTARTGVLSVQALGEFYVTVARKIAEPLSVLEAGNAVGALARRWPVFDLTPAVVLNAVRAVEQYRLAYWDALLWATARLNQIAILLTEDGPTGATIERVRWVNPFADGFDLSALL